MREVYLWHRICGGRRDRQEHPKITQLMDEVYFSDYFEVYLIVFHFSMVIVWFMKAKQREPLPPNLQEDYSELSEILALDVSNPSLSIVPYKNSCLCIWTKSV